MTGTLAQASNNSIGSGLTTVNRLTMSAIEVPIAKHQAAAPTSMVSQETGR
jgi:hypothetical protein